MNITSSRKQRMRENLIKRLSLIPRKKMERVLDAGCGDGAISRMIGSITKAQVYGVDISSDYCKSAHKRGLLVKKADIEKGIPFGDNYFDLVFAGEVIEHLKDPDAFVREIQRVLKDKGIFVITTPNLASWHNRIMLVCGIQPYNVETSTQDARIGMGPLKRLKNPPPAGHLRIFTMGALKDLLEFHGFTVEAMSGYPSDIFPNPIYFFEKLISFFPSLASQLLMRAKKGKV